MSSRGRCTNVRAGEWKKLQKKNARERARAYKSKIKGRGKGRESRKKGGGKMMPFTPQLSDSVIEGRAIYTFRYNPYPFYPKVGETFRAHSEREPLPGVYVCRKRVRTTIQKMKRAGWRGEGLPSPEAYESLMKLILKTEDLDYERMGYLYVFERLE